MALKPFEVPDQNLWDEVKQSILALSQRKSSKSNSRPKTKLEVNPKPLLPKFPPEAFASPPRKTNTQAPPIVALERRTAQRLGRGQLEPESRIDLHGETLETARQHLLHFLAKCRQRGDRIVLVITGKGASPLARHTLHGLTHFHIPEREGKLRREVPLWFHEAQFRIHIVGFQPAHPRHGGGGAFYVRLRKAGGE
jgi:DNA-nicking Smr family endonuclease